MELFAERGVEATTVDDIADAVDVSARTFHRYFAAKEDVLFADYGQRQATFESFLTARPDEEPLLDTLQAAAHGLTDNFLADPTAERRRMQLISTSYTLRARSLQHTDIFDGLLRQHVAQRLSLDPAEPLPRVLAACTIAALRTARERWLDDEHLDYHAEIDKSFALLAEPPDGDHEHADTAVHAGGAAREHRHRRRRHRASPHGGNPWIPMSVIMVATIMVALDTTIVNVALHQIGVDLGAGDDIEWVVTAYLLAVCASQPATGWLSDRFGRKQIFLGSVFVFTVASALCAFAPTLGWLIVFRVLQGLGGGALIPIGMAMALGMFPRDAMAAPCRSGGCRR